MDRLALLIVFGVGLGYGRILDPQFRRDLRWKIAKRLHPMTDAERAEWRKARARKAANG